MSKMRSNGKPPLGNSPIQLRSRRVLRSSATTIQTPPGGILTFFFLTLSNPWISVETVGDFLKFVDFNRFFDENPESHSGD